MSDTTPDYERFSRQADALRARIVTHNGNVCSIMLCVYGMILVFALLLVLSIAESFKELDCIVSEPSKLLQPSLWLFVFGVGGLIDVGMQFLLYLLKCSSIVGFWRLCSWIWGLLWTVVGGLALFANADCLSQEMMIYAIVMWCFLCVSVLVRICMCFR